MDRRKASRLTDSGESANNAANESFGWIILDVYDARACGLLSPRIETSSRQEKESPDGERTRLRGRFEAEAWTMRKNIFRTVEKIVTVSAFRFECEEMDRIENRANPWRSTLPLHKYPRVFVYCKIISGGMCTRSIRIICNANNLDRNNNNNNRSIYCWWANYMIRARKRLILQRRGFGR